jgi:thiosulfate dehydrogenase (quinone) large subunit
MSSANASAVYLRLALGATFLYSVGDRFGWWGPPGTRGVNWGNFERFLLYTGKITAFMPHALTPMLGWSATVLETVIGVCLILGLYTQQVALGGGILLGIFALSMTATTGLGSALTLSVFSTSAGAFLLAHTPRHALSVDSVIRFSGDKQA